MCEDDDSNIEQGMGSVDDRRHPLYSYVTEYRLQF
jgi:hypothetical protein